MVDTRKEHVVVFLITDTGLYLSQRLNTPSFQGKWQCCGGGVEEGENSLLAAIRELREETGLDLEDWRFSYWGNEYVDDGQYKLYFWAVRLKNEIPKNTEPHMHGDWELVPKDEILSRDVLPGIRSKIAQINYFKV